MLSAAMPSRRRQPPDFRNGGLSRGPAPYTVSRGGQVEGIPGPPCRGQYQFGSRIDPTDPNVAYIGATNGGRMGRRLMRTRGFAPFWGFLLTDQGIARGCPSTRSLSGPGGPEGFIFRRGTGSTSSFGVRRPVRGFGGRPGLPNGGRQPGDRFRPPATFTGRRDQQHRADNT